MLIAPSPLPTPLKETKGERIKTVRTQLPSATQDAEGVAEVSMGSLPGNPGLSLLELRPAFRSHPYYS